MLNSKPDQSFYVDSDLDKDEEIKQKMDRYYADAIYHNQTYWNEASIDARFKAGDQDLWGELFSYIPNKRRQVFNFNRIRRVCSMITGYQRRNRKTSIAIPIENSDEETADQFSKIILWAMNKNNALETISQAFDGAVTTGMNLLSVWMDYRDDPVSGDICVDNMPYNSYLIDPFFRKHDLSDCNFLWTRKFLSKGEVISLFQDKKDVIKKINPGSNSDGKFQFMPESFNTNLKHLLKYDEFWYRDYREQKLLVDTVSGETIEWKGSEEELEINLEQNPEVILTKNTIQTVKLAIVAEGHVLYNGPNPMGIDQYPFVPVLGYYEPHIPYFPLRIQGVVRGLRHAQFLYNRRKVIELDILESQINSGFKYKADSLVNIEDIYSSGQGRGVALKQEAQMSDVEKIQPSQIPSSMIHLSRLLGEEIQQISGVNEELLGSATDDKAGVLSMLRQGAGLTTLQTLFDQLDFSQKTLGRLFIELIQANFAPGKVKRIINEEPTYQFYSKGFGKYDVAIEEGANTTTQRQMHFQQLLTLRETGIPIPPKTLIEASTLQNKKKLIEAIEQEEQAAKEIENAQKQAAMDVQEASIKDLYARAEANVGLAMERGSRVQENRAFAIERLSQSEENKAMSRLNEARTIRELDGISMDQTKKLLDLSEMLNSRQSEERAQEKETVTQPNAEELAILAEGGKDPKSPQQQDTMQEMQETPMPDEQVNQVPMPDEQVNQTPMPVDQDINN